eukprot:scaffold60937_cov24-Phaeocystis_antarctica.AAC.1
MPMREAAAPSPLVELAQRLIHVDVVGQLDAVIERVGRQLLQHLVQSDVLLGRCPSRRPHPLRRLLRRGVAQSVVAPTKGPSELLLRLLLRLDHPLPSYDALPSHIAAAARRLRRVKVVTAAHGAARTPVLPGTWWLDQALPRRGAADHVEGGA